MIADIEQRAGMLLGDFIRKAVAEVQHSRMRTPSPSRIGGSDPACRGRCHRYDLKAKPIDHAAHLFADVAPGCDDQSFRDGSGGNHALGFVSRIPMQASGSCSPSAIAISAEVSTAIIRASRRRRRGSPGFSRHSRRRGLWPRPPGRLQAVFCALPGPGTTSTARVAPPRGRVSSARFLHPLRHVRSTPSTAACAAHGNPHR
jgi:hypothetical protein